MVFSFIIDTKTNKVYMTGNVSSVEVTPVPNGVNGTSRRLKTSGPMATTP